MIKHIVMWRLHDHAEGNDKITNAQLIKDKLEALNGIIPEINHLEVGLDFINGEMSSDVVLYSEFDSREALTSYQQHPEHVAAGKFVVAVAEERRVVDYIID